MRADNCGMGLAHGVRGVAVWQRAVLRVSFVFAPEGCVPLVASSSGPIARPPRLCLPHHVLRWPPSPAPCIKVPRQRSPPSVHLAEQGQGFYPVPPCCAC